MKLKIPRSIFRSITNKYLAAFLVFSIWMIFIDDNNILFLRKNINKLKKYRAEKVYYQKKIEADSIRLKELKEDAKDLEAYAREEFLMKKENEDIFLVIEK